jgi:hypothetical protein
MDDVFDDRYRFGPADNLFRAKGPVRIAGDDSPDRQLAYGGLGPAGDLPGIDETKSAVLLQLQQRGQDAGGLLAGRVEDDLLHLKQPQAVCKEEPLRPVQAQAAGGVFTMYCFAQSTGTCARIETGRGEGEEEAESRAL